MRDGFYLSYGYDLTASRQRRIHFEEQKKDGVEPIEFIACDSRYFWNKNILQGFQENNISSSWYTPII